MDLKDTNSHREDLWRCYRVAFDEFAKRARAVQDLKAASNPCPDALDSALRELDRARVLYNTCRDTLACALLSPTKAALNRPSLSAAPDQFERVKTIAELLWESEGRRQGCADENWYRAERIIRSAVVTPKPAWSQATCTAG